MRREPAAFGAAMENYKTRRFGLLTVGGNYSSALLPIVDLQSRDGSALLEEIMQSVPPAVPGSFDEDLTSFVLSVLRNHHEACAGYFTYPAQSDFRGQGTGADVIRIKLPEN